MNKITTPAEFRGLLLECAMRVMDGTTSVAQAGAVADLSAELNRSVQQEWEMRLHAAEHLSLEDRRYASSGLLLEQSDD